MAYGLIKPTVTRKIGKHKHSARSALDDMDAARSSVIRIDGNLDESKAKNTVR